MPDRLPHLTMIRLWAALLVTAIGLQAAEPFRAPLEQTHGSAFSATTYEVVISPRRGDDGAVQISALSPALLPDQATVTPSGNKTLAHVPAPRPDSTGPPRRELSSWRPAPRAPPIA